jgi:glutathione S-transferase
MSTSGLKPIIFYDIPSIVQGRSCSPNTTKTRYVDCTQDFRLIVNRLTRRYCLAFKGLPFETVWIECPNIKPFYEQNSLAPTTSCVIEGIPTPVHTLPVIMDPNTNKLVSDTIAQYLDEQYPDMPKVLPYGTAALIYAFQTAFLDASKNATRMIMVKGAQTLNPETKEFYIPTRAERFGIPWEEFSPPEKREEQWNELRAVCNTADGWYAKSSGQFILGDTPCFADFMVAGRLKWIQNCFEMQEWEEIKSWNGGRWGKLVEATDKYVLGLLEVEEGR